MSYHPLRSESNLKAGETAIHGHWFLLSNAVHATQLPGYTSAQSHSHW